MRLFTRQLKDGRTLTCDVVNGVVRFAIDGLKVEKKSIAGVQTLEDLRGKKWAEELVSAMEKSGSNAVWNCQIGLKANEADLIAAAKAEHNNQPEIRLPRERQDLVDAVSNAWNNWSCQRERDYDNDIGFHNSPDAEKAVKAAEQALKDFDEANPELAAKIAAEKAKETERQIQSAMNS